MSQFQDSQGEYREKRAESKADFGLNWKPFIGDDPIATSVWGDAPEGITKEISPPESKTDFTTSLWLSGGTEGQEYDIPNTVTTVAGRRWVRLLRIKVVPLLRETPAFDFNELVALRKAYAQGVLRVRYGIGADQKEVEYPSGDELLKRIRTLEAELSPEPATTRRRQVRMSTGKGF